MKFFFRAAIAALFAVLGTAANSQTPAMDAVNFKGSTNVFVSRHGTGAPTSSCTGLYHYIQDDDTTSGNPTWECQSGTMIHLTGTPALTANLGVATNGSGKITTAWEKGYATVGNVTSVAYDFDRGMGKFDPRYTVYDGGILGPTPWLAMQDLSNDIICYQATTGLHANVTFPPGVFKIGTPTATTLNLPAGAYFRGASGNYDGSSTILQASYNNVLAIHIVNDLSATCPTGTLTSTLTAGRWEGIGENGCGNVTCVNVPGDTNTYVLGGPHQDSIKIEDSHGLVDLVGASNNGGNGVEVSGLDPIVRSVWGTTNAAWYLFGHTQAGQVYNPTTDGWHCNIMLTGLDGTFEGTFETNGALQTPGAEYMHLCSTYWGGGDTHLGSIFSNRDEIGLVRDGSNGRVLGGRIDAPMGEGILALGAGNSFNAIDNSTSCSGFSTTPRGTVFGPYIATLGTGMTNGTYVVPATGGGGTGATLTVVVVGGKASTITVSNPGSGYTSTPTFTMTGTGGTPATIGATTYRHCDYIDDESGDNSWSNVKNVYESFFGSDFSTGGIWFNGAIASTFDRGTTGNFEKPTIPNEGFGNPKGWHAHKDTPDPFFDHGGVGVTGPAVSFTGGTHFTSGDTTPTNWSGPFVVDNIMQDLWINGGTGFATLPASAGWQTCSTHDLTMAPSQWYHFQVYQDDNPPFTPVGTNLIFKEQCDTIFEDYFQPGFTWLAAHSTLPTVDSQATLDVAGTIAVRPYPALPTLTVTVAGGASSFNYCYAVQVWVAGGKQTSASVCNPHTPPPTSTGLDNVFLHLPLPQNWLRFKIYLNTTTDPSFTPGVWWDISTPNGLPQPATTDFLQPGNTIGGLPITVMTPTDTSVLATANLSLNMTGTYNISTSNTPASSSTLCVPGQTREVPAVPTGHEYYCDSEDHWIVRTDTWATF